MLDTTINILHIALVNTGLFLAATALPVVGLCIILLMLGRWMNYRLLNTFGFRSLYILAWLGTPIHELSHYLACKIGRHEVKEFKPFKPDPKTGSLGYVRHSYRQDKLYQRVVGNAIVSIAPFFGGATIIFMLTYFFYPQLIPDTKSTFSSRFFEIENWGNLYDYLQAWVLTLKHFLIQITNPEHLSDWKFALYVYAMISISAHLSPSRSDFNGFWGPAIFILLLVVILHILLAFLNQDMAGYYRKLGVYTTALTSTLIVALFFSLLATALIWITTSLARLVIKPTT